MVIARAYPLVFLICLVTSIQAHSEGLGSPSQQRLVLSTSQGRLARQPAKVVRQTKVAVMSCRTFDVVDCARPREEAKKETARGFRGLCQRLSNAGLFVGLAIPLGIFSFRRARKNPAYKIKAEAKICRMVFSSVVFSLGGASVRPRLGLTAE